MIAPLRWVTNPSFNALILRRTFAEIEETLVERSRRIYSRIAPDASYNAADHVWRWPGGARIRFGYLERDEQVLQYQGAEFQYIGFDELTHFTEYQYRYMLSRARGTAGLPIRIRAGTNPGGPGHEWVQARWQPWLGEQRTALPGEVLFYVNPAGCHCFEHTDADQMERYVARDYVPRCVHDIPFSRVFIPAKVEDNPKIDPTYVAQLGSQDALTRAQLRDGNWLIRAAPGLLFRRAWFNFLDAEPAGYRWVRWWDRAATDADPKKHNDPDWTVGVKLGIGPDKRMCIGNVVRVRATPQIVKATIKATAELDGRSVRVTGGLDPGAAGVFEHDEYTKALLGWNVRFYPETGDKIVRAGPISAQCEAGNVSIVRGLWNEPFLRCLENFPNKKEHDDDVDALSGAFEVLVGHAAPSYDGVQKITGTWGSGRVGR
jgi:predicted phage terminase large subunit-like protein